MSERSVTQWSWTRPGPFVHRGGPLWWERNGERKPTLHDGRLASPNGIEYGLDDRGRVHTVVERMDGRDVFAEYGEYSEAGRVWMVIYAPGTDDAQGEFVVVERYEATRLAGWTGVAATSNEAHLERYAYAYQGVTSLEELAVAPDETLRLLCRCRAIYDAKGVRALISHTGEVVFTRRGTAQDQLEREVELEQAISAFASQAVVEALRSVGPAWCVGLRYGLDAEEPETLVPLIAIGTISEREAALQVPGERWLEVWDPVGWQHHEPSMDRLRVLQHEAERQARLWAPARDEFEVKAVELQRRVARTVASELPEASELLVVPIEAELRDLRGNLEAVLSEEQLVELADAGALPPEDTADAAG